MTATAPPLVPPRLILCEFLADPAAVSDTEGEWIEIFNAGADPVNLKDWLVSDLDSDRHVIAHDLLVQPGQYVVLARNGDRTVNGNVAVHYVYSGIQLANEADELSLTAPWGVEVDRVVWGEAAGLKIRPGLSYERITFQGAPVWVLAHEPWPGSAGDSGSPGAPYIAPAPTQSPTPTLTPLPVATTPAPPSSWQPVSAPGPLVIDEVYAWSADGEYVVLRNWVAPHWN